MKKYVSLTNWYNGNETVNIGQVIELDENDNTTKELVGYNRITLAKNQDNQPVIQTDIVKPKAKGYTKRDRK